MTHTVNAANRWTLARPRTPSENRERHRALRTNHGARLLLPTAQREEVSSGKSGSQKCATSARYGVATHGFWDMAGDESSNFIRFKPRETPQKREPMAVA